MPADPFATEAEALRAIEPYPETPPPAYRDPAWLGFGAAAVLVAIVAAIIIRRIRERRRPTPAALALAALARGDNPAELRRVVRAYLAATRQDMPASLTTAELAATPRVAAEERDWLDRLHAIDTALYTGCGAPGEFAGHAREHILEETRRRAR